MKITNVSNLPEPVYMALCANNYSRGDSNRSATQILKSPRQRILDAENDSRIVKDCTDFVWSAFGSSFHLLMEQADVDGNIHISEQRLQAEVEGWVISGAIDLQSVEGDFTYTIRDYKVTSVYSVIYGKSDWINQLNIYAWLVEQDPSKKVGRLEVIAILRDWNRRDAEKDSNYPQKQIVVIQIPLWNYAQRDQYVRGRVKIHQDAEFDRLTGVTLPYCTDEERWVKPTKYAVKKGKNIKALRVFDTSEEADDHIKGLLEKDEGEKKKKYSGKANQLWIEERRGEATRCAQGWCDSAPWCDQWQAELREAEKEAVENDA